MLKIQRPKIHDNTDADLIVINKTKLSHNLELVRRFCASSNNTFAWLGLGVTFLITALITEKFIDIGSIPGETIRSVFVVLGLVGFGLFIKDGFHWFKLKNKYNPDSLVAELLNNEPLELESLKMDGKNRHK